LVFANSLQRLLLRPAPRDSRGGSTRARPRHVGRSSLTGASWWLRREEGAVATGRPPILRPKAGVHIKKWRNGGSRHRP
jgi:hypothetical protein